MLGFGGTESRLSNSSFFSLVSFSKSLMISSLKFIFNQDKAQFIYFYVEIFLNQSFILKFLMDVISMRDFSKEQIIAILDAAAEVRRAIHDSSCDHDFSKKHGRPVKSLFPSGLIPRSSAATG